MFWLGLLTTTAYVPGWTGAAIPTNWAVLSAALPLVLWFRSRSTVFHWCAGLFVVYVCVSCFWAPSSYDAVWALWQIAIIALAFWLGSACDDLRPLWCGLAAGMTVSSAVAVVQWLGYRPVLQTYDYPGLFVSPMLQGQILALVATALLVRGLWRFLPGLIPGFVLSMPGVTHSDSRGTAAALFLGILAACTRSMLVVTAFLVIAAVYAIFHVNSADAERILIWRIALSNLTEFGNGAGSFIGIVYHLGPKTVHPEYVHNDYLQLVYEFGIGAALLLPLAWLAFRTGSAEWPVLVVFATMAFYSFPLHTPVTAFIGAVAAGSVARRRAVVRNFFDYRRLVCLPWRDFTRRGEAGFRSALVSVQPEHKNEIAA